MKAITILGIFLISCFAVIAQKQFVVDPNAQMRTLKTGFTKIKVSHGIDLYLSQSDKEAIAVSASEEKYISDIKTVVEGGVLKIYFDGDKKWSSRNRKLKAYVSFKTLEDLDASGASDIVIAGVLKAGNLRINLSGASDLKGEIQAEKLFVESSGASDMTISGRVNHVDIQSSGASDFKGFDLIAESCSVRCSGASDVNITVNKLISADLSGASNVNYKGDAVMKDVQSSGASNIRRRS